MERRNFLKIGLAGAGAFALADKSWALEYYPKPSDKKWAVLYGSWTGTARDAGVWISEGMGGIADVFDIREKPNLKNYDHIVIGSAIRYNIHPELKEYIIKNRNWLKPKIRGLYVVCNNMGKPVGEEHHKKYIDDDLAEVSQVRNVPAKVFRGRVTKILIEPDIAEKMKQNGLPDTDNLKRAECMEFGRTILAGTK